VLCNIKSLEREALEFIFASLILQDPEPLIDIIDQPPNPNPVPLGRFIRLVPVKTPIAGLTCPCFFGRPPKTILHITEPFFLVKAP